MTTSTGEVVVEAVVMATEAGVMNRTVASVVIVEGTEEVVKVDGSSEVDTMTTGMSTKNLLLNLMTSHSQSLLTEGMTIHEARVGLLEVVIVTSVVATVHRATGFKLLSSW